MGRFERAALSALLYATTCVACAHPRIPMFERPDTRKLSGFTMDSSLVRQAAEYFQASLPNERALCLSGRILQNPQRPKYLIAVIDSVWPALADSADQFHVYFPTKPQSGCRGFPLAVAHDHTTVTPLERCFHSDPDAVMLASDKRLLFSLVFCPFGRGEVLFAEGRRGEFVWQQVEP
jgi:hypothetical protein